MRDLRGGFQSTHSLRSATPNPQGRGQRQTFQSTHSLRSATFRRGEIVAVGEVSIHALLAECDMTWKGNRLYAKSFNPRTPCGVRQISRKLWNQNYRFQSTHSLRSATGIFNFWNNKTIVSIHALLAECDASSLYPHK